MNAPTVIFSKIEKKKKSKIIFTFYPATLNIICFVKKNTYIFEVLSMYF